MPRKPSSLMIMQEYPPLPTRGWLILVVLAVRRLSRIVVRFELGVIEDVRQAGRILNYDLPAVLTPNSPLCRFLADGFRVRVADGQSFELKSLVGRRFQARFDQGADGCLQAIVAARPFEHRTIAPAEPASNSDGKEGAK
ncbi:MAG: hypothetical protein KA354_14305 [Phycisphaerae bacterium]|nr:hypothetical protein [Phycisphaerae bacterium]